ncbi:hypothetical protein [Pseudohalocynthiibacter sp. F2068]|uniref:hypothetical protein n=1 Tax=Pseudohalocynthiibacter sp. F2068 TaxID=2926418 RepID=UPI001FF54815|nr:hypothetical protein [Pseudohalocynthiibacter sp. F2068]MCK0103880.1 hypothetical protein [Pseudohalocynthiibacter sp. F2068]
MVIGVVILGMLFGIIAGATALYSGLSFLTALWLYTCVGTLTSLVTVVAVYFICVFQKFDAKQQSYR